MSHDFRTPLNAIAGYADLMEMGIHGPVTEAQQADLGRIKRSQKHLVGLINDILNFAKVSRSELSYAISDVNVRDVLEASVALVEPLIAQKGLSVDPIVCDRGVVARADAERVTQILLNLLSNAVRFTPSGGRLAFDCHSIEEDIFISVSDTGVGIRADKLEAIFDPFVQVTGGLADRDHGVGLGLAISRGLARAMGGDLSAESQFGVGSTFVLRLPVAAPDGTRVAPKC